jgi:hypothetical protein
MATEGWFSRAVVHFTKMSYQVSHAIRKPRKLRRFGCRSVNHKGAAWSGPERRQGERSKITQMSGQIFAVFARGLAASRSARAPRTEVIPKGDSNGS